MTGEIAEAPKAAQATLAIYNLNGQLIRTLISDEITPGPQRVLWDGTDSHGHRVATGIYLYRLETADFVAHRKMVLVR